jgi:glycosyltransferase involved in cell wall biosynthesis
MNKYIISAHVLNDGPAQALRDYLIKNKGDFLWITHPLFYLKKLGGSGYQFFLNGKEVKKVYFGSCRMWEPIKYICEILLNLFFVFKLKNSKDYIYIGYDNLNAFSGVILKKFGLVKKSIYYVVDYTPKRFANKVLNYIYHKIDQFCVKYSNETWSLNEKAMNEARKKFYNFDAYQKGFSIQKEMPMGFWKDRIVLKDYKDINKNQIVFLGVVLKKQGIQFILKALTDIVKTLPDIKFVVIGDGDYLSDLKLLANDLNIAKH